MREKSATIRIDPLGWERQVTANSARLVEPYARNEYSLRLIHLPALGTEIVWDFIKTNERHLVTVTRFLESLREKWIRSGNTFECIAGVPKEISKAELPLGEPVVREIEKGIVLGCRQGLENRMDVDHYFLWFQDSSGFSRVAAITNPFSQPHSESWQRLINRAIGSGLFPPRRFAVQSTAAT